MKDDQNATNFVPRKSMNLGQVKGLIFVVLLTVGSSAVLAGCKKDTPTAENSPAVTDSPVAANTPTTEKSPTAINSPVGANIPTTEKSPTAIDSPVAVTSPSTSNTTQAEKVAKAEATLKSLYTEKIGVPIDSVNCPDKANFKAGGTFECQATAQGTKFGIQVKVRNNEGGFESNVQGRLLNLSKLEELLKTSFKEKAKVDVTADCGGKIRVAKVGDSFTCEVKNNKGETRKATITVKDEQGNINVKI